MSRCQGEVAGAIFGIDPADIFSLDQQMIQPVE
jgi:hypothetical protein